MALEPGSTAGPYRIIEQLGRGGMASVYKAYEPALDRYVALKVLPREFLHDPTFAERFRREARAIASLEHPNIIPIYNFDIQQPEGIPWMAMRLISGGALSDISKRQALPLVRAVQILRGTADALDYAHVKKVVHRDIKPQNILLDEADRVYLADFGIAKMLEGPSGLTATGMISGTPQYMAPEQAMGKKVDHRADIYALGIVAYKLFTGRVPFDADTAMAVLMKHIQDPIPLPPPSQVPEPMLRALLKAVAKPPEDRWASAGAFVAALEAALAGAPIDDGGELPTVEVTRVSARASAPTAAWPSTAVPPATAVPPLTGIPPATAIPPTVLRPDGSLPPVPAARRPGGSPLLLVGLGAVGLAVLTAVGLVVLSMRAGPSPSPSPEPPPVAASAAPVPPVSLAPATTPATMPPVSARPPAAPEPTVRPTPRLEPKRAPEAARVPEATRPPEPTRPAVPAISPVVQGLVDSLGARDKATRWRAAEALGNLGPEARLAVPELVAALRDPAPDVRWRAAEALGKIGPEARSAVPALAAVLRDSDDLVRGEAAKALGRFGPAAAPAVPELAEALHHADVAFRREAARALARMNAGAREAVPALADALRDKDKFVRMESARALGNVGPAAQGALPALAQAARDPEMLVARQAQEALKKVGGQ